MPHRHDPIGGDGEFIRIEAEGVAYLGDDDTLGEARGRDYENALERAAAQGARTYVETYRRSEYGSLTDDVVEEAVAGVLSGVQVLDEGDVGSVLASECERCRG